MFDPTKLTLPPRPSLAKRLNYAMQDCITHGVPVLTGCRFVGLGEHTAYLKTKGAPAICVHYEGRGDMISVYVHPSRTPDEAWKLAQTNEGCTKLAADPDMVEERFDPGSGGIDAEPGLYEVVLYCGGVVLQRNSNRHGVCQDS